MTHTTLPEPKTAPELVEVARDYLTMAREAVQERSAELAQTCIDLADAYLEHVLRKLARGDGE